MLTNHKLSLNLKKTKIMFFGMTARLPKLDDIVVSIGDTVIEHVDIYKYLGVMLDSRLSFSKHIDMVRNKAIPKIKTLGRISQFVNKDVALYLYQSLVMSRIEYADVIQDGLSQTDSLFLQRIQNYGLGTLLKCNPRTHITDLHDMANLEMLSERRKKHVCVQVHKGLLQESTGVVNEMFARVSDQRERESDSIKC